MWEKKSKYHLLCYLIYTSLRSMGKEKVFCVGLNKTGTTSLECALKEMGYIMGYQSLALRLGVTDWVKRDFRRLILFCRTAQAFQDAPFSYPYTYQALDAAFPNSKFILTVRDSPQQWYESFIRYYGKKYGTQKQDIQQGGGRHKGYPWKVNRSLFDTPEDEPYKKDVLIDYYVRHNESVIEYFRHRPSDLLVINVAERESYNDLCEFLGKPMTREAFPWANKTK